MQQIPIIATPNQEMSFSFGGSFYTIRLATRGNNTNITVIVNDELIVSNARLVAGAVVVQSLYLLPDVNFMLITTNNEITDYTKFGDTQLLFLFANSELASAA